MRINNWMPCHRIVIISMLLASGLPLQGKPIHLPADAFMTLTPGEQATLPSDLQVAFDNLKTAEALESPYIGKAGLPSENLQDLRVILASDEAERTFLGLYAEGNVTGRMYAIIGLQLLQKVDQVQSLLLDAQQFSKETVTTIEGCIVSDRTVQVLLKEIESGYYLTLFSEITP